MSEIAVIEIAVIFFVSLGTFFTLLGAIGVFRLGNFFQRIHAPTKASTLGLIFLLTATALALRETAVTTKAILAILFFAATAPAGAHLLARAAYQRGVRPNPETGKDAYENVRRASGEGGSKS